MADKVLKDSYFDGYDYYGCKVKSFLIREGYDEYKPVTLLKAFQVYQMFRKLIDLDRERLYAIFLDAANQIIGVDLAFQGTLNSCMVHPREIFKAALLCSAASIILLHVHLSGNPTPSSNDKILTERMVTTGKTIGIHVVDHVIIGLGSFYSFYEKRLIQYDKKISRYGES